VIAFEAGRDLVNVHYLRDSHWWKDIENLNAGKVNSRDTVHTNLSGKACPAQKECSAGDDILKYEQS